MSLRPICISLLLFALSALVACAGFKGNASKYSGAHYAEFFVNDSTSQYFIKPLDFAGTGDLRIDFTFRKVKQAFPPVVVNLSILTEQPVSVREILLRAGSATLSPQDMQLLFKEKQKKYYVQRYSLVIPYEELQLFFAAAAPAVLVNEAAYSPTNKSARIMADLNRDFFGFVLSAQ